MKAIAYESLIELDYLYLLEFDENVLKYYEQPFKIEYLMNKRKRSYTPDFLVYRTDKTQIIEIKPYNKYKEIINDETKKIKYVMAHKYCVANSFEFKIVTDQEIRSGCHLRNIKYLFAFSRIKIPASIKMSIRNFLLPNGSTTINTLLERLSTNNNDINKCYSYILSLIYSHDVNTDLNKDINKYSTIWI